MKIRAILPIAVAMSLTLVSLAPSAAKLEYGGDYTFAPNHADTLSLDKHAHAMSHATPAGTAAAAPQIADESTMLIAGVRTRQMLTAEARGQDNHSALLIADNSNNRAADSAFVLTAEIDNIDFIDSDDFTGFHVLGTIDADQFKRAWLMIGAGREPTTWTYVGQKQKYPIRNGVLSKIKLSEFEGSDIWQVVVKVEHRNGVVRSDTYLMKIQ